MSGLTSSSTRDFLAQTAVWKGRRCHQTPDDLWNFAEQLWTLRPLFIIEVGPGEGGTSQFLHDLGAALHVASVDRGDPVPLIVPSTCVILDGDVYDKSSVWWDLDTYGRRAQWLVVCHTVREDWGAGPALASWLPVHPEWQTTTVRHPTRHTWLERS